MRMIRWHPQAVRVDFSPDDLAAIERQAVERQAPKNGTNVRDKRISKLDNVRMHFLGLLGEHAAARVLKLDVNLATGLTGVALEDLKGQRIEVKCLQGYLAFPPTGSASLPVGADAVVLTTRGRAEGEVWVQGWIRPAEFMERYFVDDFGYGPSFCMQPADLHSILNLRRAIYCPFDKP